MVLPQFAHDFNWRVKFRVNTCGFPKCEREIFARKAMVDQAQECLRYQRKILNILEVLNIEKLTRSVFWLLR